MHHVRFTDIKTIANCLKNWNHS